MFEEIANIYSNGAGVRIADFNRFRQWRTPASLHPCSFVMALFADGSSQVASATSRSYRFRLQETTDTTDSCERNRALRVETWSAKPTCGSKSGRVVPYIKVYNEMSKGEYLRAVKQIGGFQVKAKLGSWGPLRQRWSPVCHLARPDFAAHASVRRQHHYPEHSLGRDTLLYREDADAYDCPGTYIPS
jgi:hypothetical protein